jgi:hypothetical protein
VLRRNEPLQPSGIRVIVTRHYSKVTGDFRAITRHPHIA